MSISVLILTKNEEQDLPGALQSVSWCDDVHLFDSYSTDRTVEIARSFGCVITQRKFDNWSAHQNWGLSNLPFKHPWVLYLDADERVSPELVESAKAAALAPGEFKAFNIRRRDFYSDGRWLKHAQISPFYIRLFQPSQIRYERLVNPVSIVSGPVGSVTGYLDHYPFSKGVGFWFERHIKYADLEARLIGSSNADFRPSLLQALVHRDFAARRRHQKYFFYRMPLRPLVKFSYMLLWRRAFLDGAAGIQYACLQSIYEYMIELKRRELRARSPSSE